MTSIESLSGIAIEPPSVPVADVATALRTQFGIDGDLSALVSERDQNFRVAAADGSRYVAKVVSRADGIELIRFQVAALQHLAEQGMTEVPRVIPTRQGTALGHVVDVNGDTLVLRVVSWVAGDLYAAGPPSVRATESFGAVIARLSLAFAGFSHPGDQQQILWDTRRAGSLRKLTHCIDDSSEREVVERALADFEQRTLEPLLGLPQQVIHNDLNGGNVLYADDEVCGIIDFGDMLRAPRIMDLSVAAAYLRDSEDPLRLIAPLVRAYNATARLSELEKALLFDLIRARLCATTTLMYWRLSERAADDPYRQKVLKEESGAAQFLATLSAFGADRFRDGLMLD